MMGTARISRGVPFKVLLTIVLLLIILFLVRTLTPYRVAERRAIEWCEHAQRDYAAAVRHCTREWQRSFIYRYNCNLAAPASGGGTLLGLALTVPWSNSYHHVGVRSTGDVPSCKVVFHRVEQLLHPDRGAPR